MCICNIVTICSKAIVSSGSCANEFMYLSKIYKHCYEYSIVLVSYNQELGTSRLFVVIESDDSYKNDIKQLFYIDVLNLLVCGKECEILKFDYAHCHLIMFTYTRQILLFI